MLSVITRVSINWTVAPNHKSRCIGPPKYLCIPRRGITRTFRKSSRSSTSGAHRQHSTSPTMIIALDPQSRIMVGSRIECTRRCWIIGRVSSTRRTIWASSAITAFAQPSRWICKRDRCERASIYPEPRHLRKDPKKSLWVQGARQRANRIERTILVWCQWRSWSKTISLIERWENSWGCRRDSLRKRSNITILTLTTFMLATQ